MSKRFLCFLVIGFCSFFLSACSTNANRPFTEEQVIQIYVATEFSPIEDAQKIVSQYDLTNDSKRRSYYKTIRDLTDTPEKYNDFLQKVDNYKRQQMADSPV